MVLALLRVSLMTAMQYRGSFLAEMFTGLLSSGAVVGPLWVVYQHVPTLAGWTMPEALLVVGFFMVYAGLVSAVVEPNLGAVVEGVRTGALDYLLVKPVDAQLAVSLQKIAPAEAWEILAGLGVLGWAFADLGLPSPAQAAAAVAMLLAGLVANYALWVLVICLSFWFVRVDNLRYLLQAASDAGRWPVSIYRGWARILLTAVVPVALVSSWPALAVLGRLDLGLAGQALGIAAGLFVVSRWLWLRALRFYSSASS